MYQLNQNFNQPILPTTFFSIIIPTFNRAHFVKDAIDSVFAQTYSCFEVIIVDDGSTDNTEQVITERYSSTSQLRYFKKENEERGVARNFGLEVAKGDYAVFLDSDDLMKPHYLDTLHNIILEHPGVTLLAAKYDIDGSGESHPRLQGIVEGWYDRTLFLKGSIVGCNFCIKIKDHPIKPFHGDRVLALTEDWLFLLENMENNKIFIKDIVCVTMRQHDGRSIHDNRKIIAARKRGTDWILCNIKLSPANKKQLIAWSHYFCGVHEYLDFKRRPAMHEAIAAIKEIIFQKQFWLLLVKSIVGKKWIKAIR